MKETNLKFYTLRKSNDLNLFLNSGTGPYFYNENRKEKWKLFYKLANTYKIRFEYPILPLGKQVTREARGLKKSLVLTLNPNKNIALKSMILEK